MRLDAFGKSGRMNILISLCLAFLLTCLSHRSSPLVSLQIVPDGKTPRPARRAQPAPAFVLRDVEEHSDGKPEGSPKVYDRKPLAACPAPVDSSGRSGFRWKETAPDYLNFFQSSHPQNFLSPPL